VEVTVIILLGKKTWLPIGAEPDEVLESLRGFDARATGHWAISGKNPMLTPLTR
jgi:hypothetical protein